MNPAQVLLHLLEPWPLLRAIRALGELTRDVRPALPEACFWPHPRERVLEGVRVIGDDRPRLEAHAGVLLRQDLQGL